MADGLEVGPLASQNFPDGLDDGPLLDGARGDGRKQRRVQEIVARGDDREVDLPGLGLGEGLDEAHGAPSRAEDDDARAASGGGGVAAAAASVDRGVDGQRLVDRREDVGLALMFHFVFCFL